MRQSSELLLAPMGQDEMAVYTSPNVDILMPQYTR